jgi:uncharacterized protein YggE
MRGMRRCFALVFALCNLACNLGAQDAGSRRGVQPMPDAAAPDASTIGEFILIDGSAEVRVDPTEARIVLAVAAKGETAAACRSSNARTIDAFRKGLQDAGVAADAVHVDFIALTPVYGWSVERQHEQNVGVEKRVAMQLQQNVHVHIVDLATVPAVRAAAFEAGMSDLVAFDYGCADIDPVKDTALRSALENARRKADLLLGATFGEKRPPLLNVRERIDVHLPPSLYRSYSPDAAPQPFWLPHDLPRFAAPRPLTTYYHGFDGRVDQVGGGLPMRPQISVVARVWLYYTAPWPADVVRPGAKEGR